MVPPGAAGGSADGFFAGGGDAVKGESGGSGSSPATAGVIDTAANIPPVSVPGLTVIDTGIRLPEGLRRSN